MLPCYLSDCHDTFAYERYSVYEVVAFEKRQVQLNTKVK